jgi:hypothetical protein
MKGTIMSWLSEYVFDPLKTLLAKVEATGESDLKALAGQVSAQLPAAPVVDAALTAFQTGLQTAVDGALTAIVGEVPIEGAVLAPAAVEAANTGLTYLEGQAATYINGLIAAAKAKLTSVAAPAEGAVTMEPIP